MGHHVVAVVLPPMGHHVVTVAVVWSCHRALLCVMSLSSCCLLHCHDCTAACYVTGRCYVSCHHSCAAAHGPLHGHGRCGVVMCNDPSRHPYFFLVKSPYRLP